MAGTITTAAGLASCRGGSLRPFEAGGAGRRRGDCVVDEVVEVHMRGKTSKALPRIIAGLRARQYKMVTLPELFSAAGLR